MLVPSLGIGLLGEVEDFHGAVSSTQKPNGGAKRRAFPHGGNARRPPEARSARRERGGIGLAVIRGYDAIGLAPQHERRDMDPMQALLQLGIVHVGRPAIARHRLAIARDGKKIRPRTWLCSRVCPPRDRHRRGPEIRLAHGEHVGDVALSRAPTLMPSASASTRRGDAARDLTAISAAIQPPNETPTSTIAAEARSIRSR